MAPKIGKAPLAAFLKNSRLDWSSSFFLFSFIIIIIKCLLNSRIQHQNQNNLGNKKAWEILLSPIPAFRPSHCPHTRISNAASPRQVILYFHLIVIVLTIRRYNTPTQTLNVALPLCMVSRLRSLKAQKITSVNAFRDLPASGLTSFHRCQHALSLTGLAMSIAKIQFLFYRANKSTFFFTFYLIIAYNFIYARISRFRHTLPKSALLT